MFPALGCVAAPTEPSDVDLPLARFYGLLLQCWGVPVLLRLLQKPDAELTSLVSLL